MMSLPSFLITIDTEGDNLWSKPREVTTHNARYLPRFQRLCENYGLKPTYLANYEMARCTVFKEFGKGVIAEGSAEIGMHLHAWDMPPEYSLTTDDRSTQPYLIEYPDSVMCEKIHIMTETLEDAFGVRIVSHRAGRWALDERYAAMLTSNGYLVDCSVTPYISWRTAPGDPTGCGGQDYSQFPTEAYFLSVDCIRSAGNSQLLQVPVTTIPSSRPFAKLLRRHYYQCPWGVRAVVNRLCPLYWFRPNGHNVEQMLYVMEAVKAEGRDYIEFMLHSSELMPGGSPRFCSDADIDKLYVDLERVFAAAAGSFRGRTLSEYYDLISSRPGRTTRGVQ